MGRMLDALKQIESQTDQKTQQAAHDGLSTAPPTDAAESGLSATNNKEAVASETCVGEPEKASPKTNTTVESDIPGPSMLEADAPEAELSFPDDLLDETAALLDAYENSVTTLPDQIALPTQPPHIVQSSEPKMRGAADVATPWPRDSRYVDLALSILSQIPLREPTSLLFVAASQSGVSAAALVPLFTALAEHSGERSLVVECDFRRECLSSRFGVESQVGLDDVLAGHSDWQSAVCHSGQDCLDVICARGSASRSMPTLSDDPDSPWIAEPQQSRAALKAMLAQMREQYRLILLENVSATDAEMSQLASLCQGTYLLLRAGQTPRSSARAAVSDIKQSGGKLLGCILLDA